MMVRAVLPCCSQLDSGSRKRRRALASHRPTETLPSTLRGLNGPEDMQLNPDSKQMVVSELRMDSAHPQCLR